MKVKKVTGILTASVLSVSLLAGCGGDSKSKDGDGVKEFTAFLPYRDQKSMMTMKFSKSSQKRLVRKWMRHGLQVRLLQKQ